MISIYYRDQGKLAQVDVSDCDDIEAARHLVMNQEGMEPIQGAVLALVPKPSKSPGLIFDLPLLKAPDSNEQEIPR